MEEATILTEEATMVADMVEVMEVMEDMEDMDEAMVADTGDDFIMTYSKQNVQNNQSFPIKLRSTESE